MAPFDSAPSVALGLELLSRPAHGTPRTPLLFVHGAFAGAWCWAEHFLGFFAEHGHPVYALSLRGHGASLGHERLAWLGLADYVDDLESALATLGECVVVGHSMGGLVVQHALARRARPLPGAVLMGSVPPTGLLGVSLAMLMDDPLLWGEIGWLQLSGGHSANLPLARKTMFSERMAEAEVARHLVRMQPESQRVVFDMMWHGAVDVERAGRTPLLVLGAADDGLVPRRAVEATAGAYAAEYEIFDSMAHAMMLEPGWRRVAERLGVWLRGRGL